MDIDARLRDGSIHLIDLALCEARLQNDARWPWIVLIPRRRGVFELEDLNAPDLALVTTEMIAAGRAVRAIAQALARPIRKINIGQLGNIVPQLHVHVVGRRDDDPAWPGPVWGVASPAAYDAPEAETAREVAVRVFEAA